MQATCDPKESRERRVKRISNQIEKTEPHLAKARHKSHREERRK